MVVTTIINNACVYSYTPIFGFVLGVLYEFNTYIMETIIIVQHHLIEEYGQHLYSTHDHMIYDW